MTRQITIDPVTRIEGHAKITLQLDEAGQVTEAHFHVTQVRGFEKICEGRPFHEMPALMARICGICPVSHLLTSARACDALLAVRIPETAEKLRRVMNLAQIVQSHALSFFYLSSPDFLLGMDAPPEKRNIVGVLQTHPELARNGIRLRQFGQEIVELLGGKRIHPAWVVPGGVSEPLSAEKRDKILEGIPEVKQIALDTLAWFKTIWGGYTEEIRSFANFPTLFMGIIHRDNSISYYGNKLRIIDAQGNILEDFEPEDYREVLGEAVEPFSYLKSPYYKQMGYPEGIYRVGPLARLNMGQSFRTPYADEELAHFKAIPMEERLSSFHYHYARLIEILYAVERIEMLLNEEDILSKHVRAHASPNHYVGVGVAEAPRGTLIHEYEIDETGLMKRANLMIATGHNNLAMNRGVLQVAQHFIKGDKITEGMLNRVEAVIRAYDPCLSCSTHAAGKMPLQVDLHDASGAIVDTLQRG